MAGEAAAGVPRGLPRLDPSLRGARRVHFSPSKRVRRPARPSDAVGASHEARTRREPCTSRSAVRRRSTRRRPATARASAPRAVARPTVASVVATAPSDRSSSVARRACARFDVAFRGSVPRSSATPACRGAAGARAPGASPGCRGLASRVLTWRVRAPTAFGRPPIGRLRYLPPRSPARARADHDGARRSGSAAPTQGSAP
ncbi:MAG: hypothetical protein RIR65_791 [Planctomycetota bacterium]